jgi:HK97 gp10 family phage protein
MVYSIVMSGLKEAISFFDAAPGLINKAVAKAMNKAGESIAGYAAGKAPRDTEKMAKGITVTKKATESNLETIIAPQDKYAVFVEKGTRPHFPPPKALEGWASRHGINPFAVTIAISRRGTKPHPFMKPAAEEAPGMLSTEVTNAIKNVLEKS